MSAKWIVIVALIVATDAAARGRQASPYTLRLVAPNIWAAIDDERSPTPAASNAGFVIGDNGVAVVDTLGTADAARELLADIRSKTTRPIAYVVDTHYHIDHVAGNGVFADTGAIVLAQRKVRCWIRSENARLLGPQIPPALQSVVDGLKPPTQIYDNAVDWPLGSVHIQVRNLPGHTGADSAVIVPDARVVFTGDLLWHDILPTLVDATTAKWIETLDGWLKDYPGYTFVPGHGQVASAADVAMFRDYLVTLRSAIAEAQVQHKTGDALIDAVLPTLKGRFGQWQFADVVARDNIIQTDAELRGVKTVPKTLPNRAACAAPY